MACNIIILCASALLIQFIAAQFCPATSAPSSCVSIGVSDNGGPLPVISACPVSASGIALASDLGLAGNVDISGVLPYLSAVAFEGQFDTKGSTPLSYGCGDCVAITQEVGNPSGNNAVSSLGLNAAAINTSGGKQSTVSYGNLTPTAALCEDGAGYGYGRTTERYESGNRNRAANDARVGVAGRADLPVSLPTVAAADTRTGAAIARQRAATVQASTPALAQNGMSKKQQMFARCNKVPARNSSGYSSGGYSGSSGKYYSGSLGGCKGSSGGYSGSISLNSIPVSSSGDLPISSVSPVSPSSISIASDLSLSGNLELCGELPFLSAVAFEGSYDTSGSGSVCYGCGDSVAINSICGCSGSSGCGSLKSY